MCRLFLQWLAVPCKMMRAVKQWALGNGHPLSRKQRENSEFKPLNNRNKHTTHTAPGVPWFKKSTNHNCKTVLNFPFNAGCPVTLLETKKLNSAVSVAVGCAAMARICNRKQRGLHWFEMKMPRQ
jgi:hypothetical protein